MGWNEAVCKDSVNDLQVYPKVRVHTSHAKVHNQVL